MVTKVRPSGTPHLLQHLQMGSGEHWQKPTNVRNLTKVSCSKSRPVEPGQDRKANFHVIIFLSKYGLAGKNICKN